MLWTKVASALEGLNGDPVVALAEWRGKEMWDLHLKIQSI